MRSASAFHSRHLAFERRYLAAFEQLLRVEEAEELDQLRHDARPPGLVTRTEAGPIVAVEVFVEEDVVPPVRILLKLLGAAVHRPASAAVAQEDPREAIGNLLRHLPRRGLRRCDGAPDKSLIPFRLLWCLQRDAWAEIVLRPRFTERLSILRSR